MSIDVERMKVDPDYWQEVTESSWGIKKPELEFVEWNGAGLPPVGTECELDWTESGRYAPAVVNFVGSNIMVVECEGEERVVYVEDANEQLRPIRTQAQTEREELISAATEILNQDHVLTERDAAEALYDAGMLRGAGE